MAILDKQPAESRLYDFDFSGKMRTGATIATVVSVTVLPASGLDVGATAFSGQIAQVRLTVGTTGVEYLLTCKVTTSDGDTLELDGRLWVEDVTVLSATEQAALDELALLVQADVCPTLTYSTAVSELRTILTKHRRARVWTLTTLYQLGTTVVVPSLPNRNGHSYRLVEYTAVGTDQLSGTTEPSWSTTRDSRVTDNHVIWEENGFDWNGSLWDVTAAARDGWLLKMAKASPSSDFETDAMAVKSSQLFEHCRAMADSFQPVYCL